MQTIISCPSCQRKLQVPDNLMGQDVQCPTCSATFLARIDGAPPVSAEPKPELPRSEERPRRRGWEEDEDDDYGVDRNVRRRPRGHYQPHRGTLILVLGIVSFFFCSIILGPIAWIMGSTDLNEIRAGRMDPEGEGTTNAGRICGMISTMLSVIVLLLVCLAVLSGGLGNRGRF